MAKPVLKWVGGKRRLIPEILGLFPDDYKDRAFHEPFFGGGALFFHLEPVRGSINDVNPRLMNFYSVLKEKPGELISEAQRYKYKKDEYYRLRALFNQRNLSDVEDAAILLYLNKTGYNGLYRVNSKGEYNVPFGRYKTPRIVDEERIYDSSRLLQNVRIFCDRFNHIIDIAFEGDIVYFDPPYLPVSDTSDFTSYSKKGFNYDDHVLLRDTCLRLHENGVMFVQSNSHVPPIIEIYDEIESFRVHTVQMNRAINSKPGKRGLINEILITNIPD